MRQYLWTVLASSTLLSACDGPSEIKIRSTSLEDEAGVMKVINGLLCPQTEGVLTRKGSASADGRSCTYAGPRGSEVQLELVQIGRTPIKQILNELEAKLNADSPQGTRSTLQDRADTSVEIAADKTASASDRPDQASVNLPGLQVESEGDKSTVRLPGMRIQSDAEGSVVNIGGIIIRSDTKTEDTEVRISGTDEASKDGVIVTTSPDKSHVRVQGLGESLRAHYRTVFKTSDQRRWSAVGYEARGPAGGPIVIATIRSRADNNDRVFDAAKELVTLNVGK